jgi:hypothetical protein
MGETGIVSSIAQLLNAIAWPSVAIAAGLFFKTEIRALFSRIRKGAGVEFDPIPQTGTTSSSTEVALSLNLPRTLATQALEQMILGDPHIKTITDTKTRENTLVLVAARALLVFQFTQVEALIWGSQLALLGYLNSKPNGETLETLKQYFYEPAKKAFPEWFVNYSFEGYMDFLQQNVMIEQVGNSARIKQQGLEYLAWRVEQRKPLKPYG